VVPFDYSYRSACTGRSHAARTAGEIIGLRKPMPYWTNQDWEDLVEDIEGVVSRLDKR